MKKEKNRKIICVLVTAIVVLLIGIVIGLYWFLSRNTCNVFGISEVRSE